MKTLSFSLDDDQIEAFERDGAVCLRQVLDEDEVRSLADAIDRQVSLIGTTPTGYDLQKLAQRVWAPDSQKAEAGGASQYDIDGLIALVRASGAHDLREGSATCPKDTGHFYLDTGAWTRDETIRALALDSDLARIAAELLGSEKINFYDDQIFVKTPQTTQRTAYHQDYTYFRVQGWKGCVMWVPVDPATLETGTINYVRGSHRWGVEYRPNVFLARTPFPGSEGEILPDIEANPEGYDLFHFDVEPGDIIVHHFRTIHGAGGNFSPNQSRRALSLRYCGNDMRYFDRPGTAIQPHHDHALHDGDPLDCAQFPVVWPRPFTGFRLSSYYRNHDPAAHVISA